MDKTRTTLLGIIGTVSGVGSAALSWEGKIRFAALVVGLLVSLATLVSIVMSTVGRRRSGAIKEAAALATLCHQCRMGTPPPQCPLPKAYRPKDCPHPDI
jgi:hypothetical protein